VQRTPVDSDPQQKTSHSYVAPHLITYLHTFVRDFLIYVHTGSSVGREGRERRKEEGEGEEGMPQTHTAVATYEMRGGRGKRVPKTAR